MSEDSFIEIDKNNLDEEWLRQPKLYHSYALRLADAKDTLTRTKAELELVTAEVSMRVRLHPDDFSLPKITDSSVESAVLKTAEYKKALLQFHKAKHEVDVLEAAVSALEHKKRALENLVILEGRDYWAEPRAPKGHKEDIDKMKTDRAFGKSRRKVKNE